jgi:selenocysteine lyase/cysteine desulfurase
MSTLEHHFSKFKKHIVGDSLEHNGTKIIYADWTASGRLYKPIERFISDELGPYVANTHTETTLTGTTMTNAYHEAQATIKRHVNADDGDALIMAGAGMTAVVNKFQRILGLRIPEHAKAGYEATCEEKPLVIITHMEHHSNQTSWYECCVDLEIINRADTGLPDLNHLKEILEKNKSRKKIIGSFSGCSNVTGIITNYHEMAEMMHEYNGLCFVDFAASAPYLKIDMHPENPKQKLDAVMFSPHKFLGGPGSSGVLIFDKSLYTNAVPDHPGGGTVTWTNPWGEYHFFDDIETREDGGTPGFLQGIKAALAIKLKDEMGLENIHAREIELHDIFTSELKKNPKIELLEQQQKNRLCIFSFYSLEKHHNLIVKLLNDKFGIQTRGGCSCAGTYGHILLDVTKDFSNKITCEIDSGDVTNKPGWVRTSLHPTMSNKEAIFIAQSICKVIDNYDEWKKEYTFNASSGEFSKNNHKDVYITLSSFKAV